ncbi:hypothetical protein [Paraburkholderia sacchari]|uniref:hypothetical protein n=1 Tax=Paraburkholderia sacchari TaxID=159450 RepID=UPI001BCFA067|nr:hypothetical protein [Paraburkholderia sacchari]
MKPILKFHQSVVDPANGHCFAIAVKWVGLMLEDTDMAEDYLTRKTRRSDSTMARRWINTKARMAASILAGAADAALGKNAQGLPVVQRDLAGPWICKYAQNTAAKVEVLKDDVEDAFDLAGTMGGSQYEAFIVSASSPPHTIGVVYDGDDVLWFDPNEGVFKLGVIGENWQHAVSEICAQTQFAPDWVLGVKL